MCSWPDFNRGPAVSYQNHKKALLQNENIEILEINQNIIDHPDTLQNFNVFWFYVDFDPGLYGFLKRKYPDAIYWFGPNILLSQAEKGITSEWEMGFTQFIDADVYCNNSEYYLERVLQFYKKSKKNVVLRYCMDLSEFEKENKDTDIEKKNDVLIYSKKRRIDKNYQQLHDSLTDLLEKDEDVNYEVIVYGDHTREEYFNAVKRSRVVAWLSIEDYCSAAQLECQYLDCPIVGTRYNLTDTFDESYWVDAQTMSNEKWIEWKEDAHVHYYDGIKRLLAAHDDNVGRPSEFIKKNYSLEFYGNYVKGVLDQVVKERNE